MKDTEVQINRVDWIAVSIYFALVMIGWFNIYAVVYDSQVEKSIFDLNIELKEKAKELAKNHVDVKPIKYMLK